MTDRLGIEPRQRVLLMGGLAGMYGMMLGLGRGARLASLRYLAENAHRLPRTRGTWYFFHKRKNYVVLLGGINTGTVTAAKYAAATVLFFATEAQLDSTLNKVSWLSTAGASFVAGSVIVGLKRLPLQQSLRSVRNFVIFGAIAGLAQDRVRGFSEASRQQRMVERTEAAERAKAEAEEGAAADEGTNAAENSKGESASTAAA